MDIITKEQLTNLNENDFVKGCVCIIDYSLTKKENTSFVSGKIKTIDGEFNFITFSNQNAFIPLQDFNFRGKACYIEGTVNKYNGVGIRMLSVKETNEYDANDFECSKYNKDELSNNLENLLVRNISEKGMELLDILLFKNEIYEKFCTAYAATSFHDNCKSGLLAHTYKMLQILEYILNIYPNLLKFKDKDEQDIKDLIFIGATLHDIGKTSEMINGIYQSDSIITHRTIGVLHLYNFSTIIETKYSKEWCYELISIINQHHDKYGEPAQTLSAYIIHLIDDIEANEYIIDIWL